MVKNRIIFIIILSLSFTTSCRKRNWIKDETGWSKFTIDKNPGWLKFYKYIPANVKANPALVVALHGCTQNAEEIAHIAGWNDLADKNGFIVMYPQQKTMNNTQRCFNWFLGWDNERGTGEAESIANATKEIMELHNVDDNRVFVTGLSAGAGMTNVMLACYPEIYSAGAPYAGPAYKSVTNPKETGQTVTGDLDNSAAEWRRKVVNASNYSGNYPRVCIVQGRADKVNHPNSSDECEEQWAAVHNLTETNASTVYSFLGNADVNKKSYVDANGDTLVVHYQLKNLGHKIAIDEGTGPIQGGHDAFYSKDINFFSSYWIAQFFGIIE